MTTSRLDSAFRQLRRVVLMRDGAGLTDAQLLELFISQKDQAAFEALVRRLGPMVLKVCRRVVGNHHDAEDVFQATFLLLARKASSLKSRDRVANWLHGVALRSSLNAKKLRAKNRARERQMVGIPEPEAAQQEERSDLQPLLDQELSRLAEIYRLPILLCDLEGISIKATAHQLGWPQGTVAGRLARGRKLLAKRLARHGLAMTGGAVLLQNSVSACVSPSLVAATVKAAGAYAAGKSAATGTISANVAILIQGGLTTMFWTKLKIATAVLVAGLIGIGGGLVTYGTVAGQTGHGDRPGIQGQRTTDKKDSAATTTDATKQDTAEEISNTDAANTDMEKLQGTWKVVQMTSNGKQFDSQKGNSWKIDGQKIVMTPGFGIGKNPTGPTVAIFQLGGDKFDTKPAPNGFNLTHPGMRAMRGVYAWDQEKLKINFSLEFWTRPNEIPLNPAKYQLAFVLEREKDADPSSLDWVRLQGQWRIVGYEENGKKKDLARGFPKDFNNKEEIEAVFKVIFDGDRFIMPEGLQETSFKLDAIKTPKQFDLIHIKEDGNEGKVTGIYSLDGDVLKICFGGKKEADSPPTSFTTKKGTDRSLMILKRWKPEQNENGGKETGKSEGAVETGQSQPSTQNPMAGNDGEKPASRQADPPKVKADAGKKDAAVAKTNHEQLRGTWRVVKVATGGPEAPLQDWHWWVGNDKIVIAPEFLAPTKTPAGRQYASYHFWGDNDDPAPAPNNINMTLQVNMPNGGKSFTIRPMTLRGIFALDGDRVTLCFRMPGLGERPAVIPASLAKNDNMLLVVLERQTAPRNTDEEKLQGDWKGTENVSFVGDLMILPPAEVGFSYKLDATKSPKQITMTYKSGNVERKTVGIYSLEGDALKICNEENEKGAVPDDFTAPEDSSRTLMVLKRVKSPGEEAAPLPKQGQRDAKEAPALPDKTKITEEQARRLVDSMYERLRAGQVLLKMKKSNLKIRAEEVNGRRLIHVKVDHVAEMKVTTEQAIDVVQPSHIAVVAEEAELTVDVLNGNLLLNMYKVDPTAVTQDQGFVERITKTLSIPLSAIDEAP